MESIPQLKLGASKLEALARLLLAKHGCLQFEVKVVGIDARPLDCEKPRETTGSFDYM